MGRSQAAAAGVKIGGEEVTSPRSALPSNATVRPSWFWAGGQNHREGVRRQNQTVTSLLDPTFCAETVRELHLEPSHHQAHHISQLTIGYLSSHAILRPKREGDECRSVVNVRAQLSERWGDRTRGSEPTFWEEQLWLRGEVPRVSV